MIKYLKLIYFGPLNIHTNEEYCFWNSSVSTVQNTHIIHVTDLNCLTGEEGNAVYVTGARGKPPSSKYKVSQLFSVWLLHL